MGGAGILNAVVEEGSHQRVLIQLQVGHDLRHRQRMGDIGAAVSAELAVVSLVRIGKGGVENLGVNIGVIALYMGF
jgi:hypothetical protein